MSKKARQLLIETMHRFHRREQTIKHLVAIARLNVDGSYTVQLTAEELALLKQEAS